MHEIGCPFYRAIGLYTNRLGQGRTFLVESGAQKNLPKNNFGLLLQPQITNLFLNWATYGAQSGVLGIERPHFWTFSLLYDGKDEMKSMLKWTTGPKSMSTILQGASSKI